MIDVLKQRIDLLQSLLPWDDPNFGLDEGWARFYPYARTARPGETIKFSLRIMNHSPVEQIFEVKPHLPQGWTLVLPVTGPDPHSFPGGRGGGDDRRRAGRGTGRYLIS